MNSEVAGSGVKASFAPGIRRKYGKWSIRLIWNQHMGRNLYILAATLAALSLLSIVLSFTNIAQQPGSPGDASLWRMTSIALICVALVVALLGILSSLFEQAERRHEAERQAKRRTRPQ